MRASEWQYLCAVHDPPKSCCAIDYCCHTLDWAANTLTSTKHFPSRLTLGTDSTTPQQQQHQVRQLTNIFRRVYRIFAHAWFQHREIFWRVEGKTGLYIFFKTVCDTYNLIPEDNYTIPPEAEGLEVVEHYLDRTETEQAEQGLNNGGPVLLQRNEGQNFTPEQDETASGANATGATAKRYRHNHSKSASIVPTVPEEDEDDSSIASEETSVLLDSSAQHPAFDFGLPIRSAEHINEEAKQTEEKLYENYTTSAQPPSTDDDAQSGPPTSVNALIHDGRTGSTDVEEAAESTSQGVETGGTEAS